MSNSKDSEVCNHCGYAFDENDECNCCPTGYVYPGTITIMYVNVYSVTRHYGGHEEGGWWYNHREPMASIPIEAISTEGHNNSCYNCYQAREGKIDPETGKPFVLCKWGFELQPNFEQKEMMMNHLEQLFGKEREGNIYSVLGGIDIQIVVERHPGERTKRPFYE